MSRQQLIQKSLFWIGFVIAALVLWYGATVIERTGLGKHNTFTSPDLLTGFYLGSGFSVAAIVYTSSRGTKLEKIVAAVTSTSVTIVFLIYLTLNLEGYIKTWPYLHWLQNGLIK